MKHTVLSSFWAFIIFSSKYLWIKMGKTQYEFKKSKNKFKLKTSKIDWSSKWAKNQFALKLSKVVSFLPSQVSDAVFSSCFALNNQLGSKGFILATSIWRLVDFQKIIERFVCVSSQRKFALPSVPGPLGTRNYSKK